MNLRLPTINKHQYYLKIFGTKVNDLNYQLAIKKIAAWIKNSRSATVCVAAVHLIMETERDPGLQKGINQAEMVTPDGMPLVWLLKLFGSKQASRVYGPTLTLKLCKIAAEKSWRVFLLGGAAGQSRLVAQKLTQKFPRLKIVGNIDTPIRPIPKSDNQAIIKKINNTGADLVFVGLGCPLQEQWMIDNKNQINSAVMIGVGAAFDFISEKVAQAPKWMQTLGLEWLFRLIQDPLRLWRRYLILNTKFIFLTGLALFVGFLGKIKLIKQKKSL
jgi:N-acetylglucosaminyldiphosphoundecaprenol N-acetyl-beta-D-mannosaminyltransferase